jgi:hypothetical protein
MNKRFDEARIRLDKARIAREKDKKKIAQIYKLVDASGFGRQEIIDFLRDVLPNAWSESVDNYVVNESVGDVQSLFVDILCLAISNSEKEMVFYTSGRKKR